MPGHQADDLGDELLVDVGQGVHATAAPLALTLCALAQQLLLLVAERRGLLEVLRVDRRFLVAADVSDAVVVLAEVRRSGHPADAQP